MMLLTGDLGNTKTYASRTWSWVGRIDPADLADGTLTVNTVKGATARAKVESRRYSVQEVPADFGRSFLLVKADGTLEAPAPQDGEVYEVHVTDHGTTCTCKAGQYKVDNCVHRDAVPALVEAGAFDQPIDPPAAPPLTEAEIDDMAAAYERERSGLWFPAKPPAADADLPACFRDVGPSAVGCPF